MPKTPQAPKDSAAKAALSEEQVINYLAENPDFLVKNPVLLQVLAAPERPTGDGVVDMQAFMIERLRGQLDEMREAAEDLIATTRGNMSTLARTHDAVLAILSAKDLEQIGLVVDQEFPALLGVDFATLVLDLDAASAPEQVAPGLRVLPTGGVGELFDAFERDVLLVPDEAGDDEIFGEAADTIESAALVRFEQTGDGLLALGSREEEYFHPGQATELLNFLARVVEWAVLRWRDSAE